MGFRADEPTVDEVFDEFWADIVCPRGVWVVEQVKRELFDYHSLLSEVPSVYLHVTSGRISKPNTLASEVIGVHDELFIDKRDAAEYVTENDRDD